MRKNHQTISTTIVTLICAMLMTGCSGSFRDTLGLSKNAPDEYLVGTNPSLIVPPSFHLPVPGSAPALTAKNTKQDIRNTLLPESSDNAKVSANGVELKLLQKADVNPNQSDIRSLLKAETQEVSNAPKKKKKGFFSSLNPFSKDEDVLDANAEEERLKEEQVDSRAQSRRPAENPLIAKK